MWQNQLSSPNRHLWPRDLVRVPPLAHEPRHPAVGAFLLLAKPGRWVSRVSHQVAPVMLWRKRRRLAGHRLRSMPIIIISNDFRF